MEKSIKDWWWRGSQRQKILGLAKTLMRCINTSLKVPSWVCAVSNSNLYTTRKTVLSAVTSRLLLDLYELWTLTSFWTREFSLNLNWQHVWLPHLPSCSSLEWKNETSHVFQGVLQLSFPVTPPAIIYINRINKEPQIWASRQKATLNCVVVT